MAIAITHQFVSSKGDGADTSLVQPSNWNAQHTIQMETARLIGRWSASTGPAQEVTVQDGLELNASGQLRNTKPVPDGGTTGQFLRKNSATNQDASWQGADTNVFETGDTCKSYRSSKTGWIIADGRTIGNTGSAANLTGSTYEALFTILWGVTELSIFDSAGVSTTRGVDAAADWTANKRLAIPDHCGRVSIGRDTQSRARVTASGTGNPGLDSTVLGRAGGVDRHMLTIAQMPAHTHNYQYDPQSNFGGGGSTALRGSSTGNTSSTGGGEAHPNVQPAIVQNVFIKL